MKNCLEIVAAKLTDENRNACSCCFAGCCCPSGPPWPRKPWRPSPSASGSSPAAGTSWGRRPTRPGRYADEAASHKVNLKPFYISATEITNAQYGRFLKATGHKKPLYWEDKNLNGPNQPVVGVTWHDAAAFCRWLTKVTGVPHELPTENQWEAAARGGLVGQPYPWGDQAPDAGGVFRANFRTSLPGATGFSFTAPVGSFPANGYGLFDMAGNVSEWCQDRYVPLPTGGPFKPGVLRLLKGGSWLSGPRDLRPAARQSAPPQYADGYIGFRVVRLPHP